MEAKNIIQLTTEEEKELLEGQQIYEMMQTPGFSVLKKQLELLGFHSWVDPREAASKEDWEWRELNGFHAANVAKEMLEWFGKLTSRSDYLQKKKNGELKVERMRL